jgi:thymidylate kinase
MDIRNQIAPKGLEFKPSSIVISDKYATILTVISYPKIISPGYLSSLTSMSGIKVVIKHIPLPFSVISKMLNKEIADLKQRYQTENDRTLQERIRQDYESLESFIQQLAASQSKIYDFQMHIMITANSEDELVAKKLQVKNYLEAMEMQALPLRFEQEKVLKSMLPIYPKQDIEERIGTPIPAPTLAAMYPFIFDSIKDSGLACLLGVDFSGGVILFNQFLYQEKKENNRNNANMIILGTSGSGKSTAAKLLLRANIRNDHQIIVIDPEGELEEMTRRYSGDFIDLGKGGDYGMINPLEVIVDSDEEEIASGLGYTILTRTIQTVKAFLKYYDPSCGEDVVNIFSEVLQETYRRFNINFDSDFTKFASKDFPTIKDVYATVRGKILSMPEKTQNLGRPPIWSRL